MARYPKAGKTGHNASGQPEYRFGRDGYDFGLSRLFIVLLCRRKDLLGIAVVNDFRPCQKGAHARKEGDHTPGATAGLSALPTQCT
jgi:hypothetical protein